MTTKKIHLIKKGTANTVCGLWADPIHRRCVRKDDKVTCKKCLRYKELNIGCIEMIKIYIVMGNDGEPVNAFRKKKDVYDYADKSGLKDWHKGETDNLFDGVSEIYLN